MDMTVTSSVIQYETVPAGVASSMSRGGHRGAEL